ncbi:MAG: hypothetical protein HYV35_03785 [Lentisphaerae bacterium]|nr:hypothetical protein [Lentisphaerota bacterium]
MWLSGELLHYYPLEHAWKWGGTKGVPSQGWYGMQLFAYLSAGVLTLVVRFWLNRPASDQAALSPRTIRTLGVLVSLTVVAGLTYMLCHEFRKWGIF